MRQAHRHLHSGSVAATLLFISWLGCPLYPAAAGEEKKEAGEKAVKNTKPAEVPNLADDDLRRQALELNNVTGDQPLLGAIVALVKDADGTKKLLTAARAIAEEKDQPLNMNATYILGRAALGLKQVDSARLFFRLNAQQATKLRSSQKLVLAYSGLLSVIDLLYLDKKFDETTKLCQEFLEMMEKEQIPQRLKAEVIRRMVRALAQQGKIDDALKMTDTLLKSREKDWRNLELKGYVQRFANNLDEAAKVYEELLVTVGKDESLDADEKKEVQSEIRYLLSGVYVELNKIDAAAKYLQGLLKEHPDDPTYHNDLGYIWADHDMNLEESERLIRKALDLDRKRRENNPEKADSGDRASYLDSLGWVLFKQKKYKEAKEAMLQATADVKDGQHQEIYDHLADVYWALGEKDDAAKAWNKAIELSGKTKRDQQRKGEIEKKLQKAK